MTSAREIDARVLRIADKLVVEAELRLTAHILSVEHARLRGMDSQRADEFALHLREAADRAAHQRTRLFKIFSRHMK